MGKKTRYVFALLTLVLCTFDVGSDWYAFIEFVRHRVSELDTKLTITLGVLSAISTAIFGLEVRNAVMTYRLLRHPLPEPMRQRRAEIVHDRWTETVTFCQTVFEDFPVTIVMYVTFTSASCTLFMRIFEDSFTGTLALAAAFLSSLWKLLNALLYCCCRGYQGVNGCCKMCRCCCMRTLRAIVALLLMGFSAYLFFTFKNSGQTVRKECFVNQP